MSVSIHGLQYGIDVTNEQFGSATTIAHLAINSFDAGWDSETLDIYTAARIVDRDWYWELQDFEYEYLSYYTATFKDGSRLTVCAWADDPADRRQAA
jgi:hypothetical protein